MLKINRVFVALICWLSSIALAGECLTPEAWREQNLNAITAIRAKIGQPLVERNSGSQAFDAPEETVISGIPTFVKILDASQIPVLRHYTKAEKVPLIQSTGGLIAGPTPYVIKGGGYKKTFEDLTGVFFTTPDFKPEQVGLGKEISYEPLDVTLPAGVSILFLEPGIYLVPGVGALPKWIQDAYLQWKATGVEPSLKMLLAVFQRIDAQGGLQKPLCVPVSIP